MNRERMIQTFCDLVRIPSESPNDKEFVAYMEALLKKEGAKTKLDNYGNLIAKFPAKNSKSTESVFFCAHADTVKPGIGIEPVVEDKIIRSKGDTILGADDKGGIAEIIEMLRSAEKHPPLEVIIARCEEITPSGAEFLDYSLIDSKYGYIIDMDEPHEVVIGGPTYIVLTAKFRGRSAHAGVAPEKGISAIQAACKAIADLKLGRIDQGSTSNVGVIKGGQNINSIPEETTVIAECRSLDDTNAWKIANEMKSIFEKSAKSVGATVEVELKTSLKAYMIPKDSKVVQLAVSAIKKNGLKEEVKAIAGGSDGTHFNHSGLQTAVLGIGARKMHSTDEYAIIDEMLATAKIITTIVEDLA